eukprot:2289826-Rhodomonas_salina.1
MSAAVALAPAAAIRARGRLFIIVSDCIPVVAAIDHGSAHSTVLQDGTEQIAIALAKEGARPISMWVRGQTLVEIGVDTASRELAQSLHDTQVTDPLWALAQALARQHFDSELHIDRDWFASET